MNNILEIIIEIKKPNNLSYFGVLKIRENLTTAEIKKTVAWHFDKIWKGYKKHILKKELNHAS